MSKRKKGDKQEEPPVPGATRKITLNEQGMAATLAKRLLGEFAMVASQRAKEGKKVSAGDKRKMYHAQSLNELIYKGAIKGAIVTFRYQNDFTEAVLFTSAGVLVGASKRSIKESENNRVRGEMAALKRAFLNKPIQLPAEAFVTLTQSIPDQLALAHHEAVQKELANGNGKTEVETTVEVKQGKGLYQRAAEATSQLFYGNKEETEVLKESEKALKPRVTPTNLN